MSALVEQPVQDPQGGGQVTGQNSNPNSGNPLTQINAGPAALAMIMIYEAMGLYATIIGLQAQQKALMVDAQFGAAKAQAAETIKEGEAAYEAAKKAGWTTIGMAAASALAMFIGFKVSTRGVAEEEAALKAKTTPMNEMEKSLSKTQEQLKAGENAENKPSKSDVKARMSDFMEGDYSQGAENPDATKEAIRRLKMGRTADDRPSEIEEKFVAEFRKQLDQNNRKSLELTQRKGTSGIFAQVAQQTVNSIGQGTSQMLTADGQKKQALHRAAAGLDGMASQLDQAAVATANDGMREAANAQSQEVQILKEIDKANSVNG